MRNSNNYIGRISRLHKPDLGATKRFWSPTGKPTYNQIIPIKHLGRGQKVRAALESLALSV